MDQEYEIELELEEEWENNPDDEKEKDFPKTTKNAKIKNNLPETNKILDDFESRIKALLNIDFKQIKEDLYKGLRK